MGSIPSRSAGCHWTPRNPTDARRLCPCPGPGREPGNAAPGSGLTSLQRLAVACRGLPWLAGLLFQVLQALGRLCLGHLCFGGTRSHLKMCYDDRLRVAAPSADFCHAIACRPLPSCTQHAFPWRQALNEQSSQPEQVSCQASISSLTYVCKQVRHDGDVAFGREMQARLTAARIRRSRVRLPS